MIELEFLGRSADAQSVVFSDTDGVRYSVLINDDLRSAVRKERTPQQGGASTPTRATLRPAEIQSLLRQGRTAQEIADRYGTELSAVIRYESPVAAEKAWAISLAKRCSVGFDSGSPALEELVINRLATRGVDPRSLTWNAQRQPGEDWEISVTFVQSAVERVATWTLIGEGSGVQAVDQEATWLTESASTGIPISALFGGQSEPDSPQNEPEDLAETEALLDQLARKRGVRQPILEPLPDEDEQDDALASSVETTRSLPYFSARQPLSVVTEDSQTPPPAEPEAPEEAPVEAEAVEVQVESKDSLFVADAPQEATPAAKKKSRRRPVPSWDEIVFGARSE